MQDMKPALANISRVFKDSDTNNPGYAHQAPLNRPQATRYAVISTGLRAIGFKQSRDRTHSVWAVPLLALNPLVLDSYNFRKNSPGVRCPQQGASHGQAPLLICYTNSKLCALVNGKKSPMAYARVRALQPVFADLVRL